MSSTLRRDPVCSCPFTDYRGLRLDANELWLHFKNPAWALESAAAWGSAPAASDAVVDGGAVALMGNRLVVQLAPPPD